MSLSSLWARVEREAPPLWMLLLGAVLLRALFVAEIAPHFSTQLYIPFLSRWATDGFPLDPWAALSSASRPPFPYGWAMLGALTPTAAAVALGAAPQWAYSLNLAAFEILLALAMIRLLGPKEAPSVVRLIWASPIFIMASYWFGFNDIVPVAILAWALVFLKHDRPVAAALVLALAVSAKLSMALALPFAWIWLFRHPDRRSQFPLFAAVNGSLLLLLLGTQPLAAWRMILENPETAKTFSLALRFGEGQAGLLLLPVAYGLWLYAFWRLKLATFDLFLTMLVGALFLAVLMTPASPGWYLWIAPLLLARRAAASNRDRVLFGTFSVLICANALFGYPLPAWAGGSELQVPELAQRASDLVQSFTFALGLILLYRFWRSQLLLNDPFGVARTPLLIAVAGDSGSGKDTLAEALISAFGTGKTAHVSGDDYHLWDRHKPMWRAMTHLNPMANDIEGFADAVLGLRAGKPVQFRHYDHSVGRKGDIQMIEPRPIVLASGLHALRPPAIRSRADLLVYLDMDEDLRRKLKVRRDVGQRGHDPQRVIASIESRMADAARFVYPQAQWADVVFSLKPVNRKMTDPNYEGPLKLKLAARFVATGAEQQLTRVLVGVCGLHVDSGDETPSGNTTLEIDGDVGSEDIAMAARVLCSDVEHLLAQNPEWSSGALGVMQLLALWIAGQKLKQLRETSRSGAFQ